MRRVALLADIHGNYHALEAVLQDIRLQKADKIYVLGDLVFKGALPERCVEAVRELDTVVLQGNIDELVGKAWIQPGFAKSPEHEAALRREMEWTRSRLSAEDLDYLAGLPLVHEELLSPGLSLRCVHATPQNVMDIVLPTADEGELQRMFEGSEARLVAYAHIHQPYVRYVGGKAIVNTGSVGLPFDGDWRASYALVEADGPHFTVSIRRVSYDLDGAVAAFEGSGNPAADSVITAIRAGRRPV